MLRTKSVALCTLGLILGVTSGFSGTATAANEFVRAHAGFLKNSLRPLPPVRLSGSFQPDVGIDDADVESDLIRGRLVFNGLRAVNTNVALQLGGFAAIRDYDFDASAVDDTRLYDIGMRIGASWFPMDSLMLTVLFTPGIFSDLDGSLQKDDVRYQGSAMATYALNDSWTLRAGLAVSEDFEQLQVIPLGGFSWVRDERLRVDVLLPREATVTWLPLENMPISFEPGVVLEGQQYHVKGQSDEVDIQIQDVRIQWLSRYTFANQVSTWLTLGANVRGQYEIKRSGANGDFDQKPSFFIGLGFGGTL